MTTPEVISRCPQCAGELAYARDDPPWCFSCEWNLGAWSLPQVEGNRRRRAVLRARRDAFALNQLLLAEFSGHLPGRPRGTRTRTLLGLASVGLLVFDLALLLVGALGLVEGNAPIRVLSLFAVLLALECRPRFPKVDTDLGEVTRQDAPSLFAVLDAARAAVGAPPISVVLLQDDYNAWCARSGVRRRVVLGLGLPLWGALAPAARLALLGHELGHLVNGDPTSTFLTQPASTTFGRLAEVLDPEDMIDGWQNPVHALLGQLIAYPLFWPPHAFCRWADGRLERLAARDRQRAEIYADALSVRLGGREGTDQLMATLLFLQSVRSAIRRVAQEGSADPQAWQSAAASAIGGRTPESVTLREQASLRYESSPSATHPPTGLRRRVTRSWPSATDELPVSAELMAAADVELSRRFAQVRRALLNVNVA